MDSRITKGTEKIGQLMPIWKSSLGTLEALEGVFINVLFHQPHPDQKKLIRHLTALDFSNLAFW